MSEEAQSSQRLARWEEYPANLNSSPLAMDCENHRDSVARMRMTCFSPNVDECEVNIVDIRAQGSSPVVSEIQESQILEEYISSAPLPLCRIISICCDNSIEPLNISEEMMLKIMSYHDIGTEFLELIFMFGQKPRDSEAGLGAISMKRRQDGALDSCYSMVYVEPTRNSKNEIVAWRTRQVAVFNRYNPETGMGLWILLHPKRDPRIQERLTSMLSDSNSQWDQLHLLVISSYLDNWRWYLNDLYVEFEETADVALTLDFTQPSDLPLGLSTLSKLQHIQDKIIPLSARFQSSLATVNGLQKINELCRQGIYCKEEEYVQTSNELSGYARKLEGHLISTEVLKSRAQGILKVLAVTLDLKNQMTAVDINHNMLSLTKDTVDDSATVRVVTIVTLVYLPASFIASLLGMNLFTFQAQDGSGFQVSRQFWVYIVLSVPLTILTVGSWVLFAKKRKDIRDQFRLSRRKKITKDEIV